MTVEKTILYIGRAIDREADMILKIVHYDNVIGVQDSVYDQVVDYFVTRGPYEKIKGKNDRVAVDGFGVRPTTICRRIQVKRRDALSNFEIVTDSTDVYILNDSGETIDRINK